MMLAQLPAIAYDGIGLCFRVHVAQITTRPGSTL
jgi:hypothetical protein